MPVIGNGIKSKEVGKSGVKTGFTSQFMSFHKMVLNFGQNLYQWFHVIAVKRWVIGAGIDPDCAQICGT